MTIPSGGTPTRLTGTTSQSAGPFQTGAYVTLINGPAPIRFRVGSTAPTAVGTDTILGAYSLIHWLVETDSQYVAVIHEDAASTFEAHAFSSSPGNGQ